MAIEHLTDEQIQDYLDGNIQEGLGEIKEHLAQCEKCRQEVNHYKSLSQALSVEPEFKLSPNFALEVTAGLEEEQAEKFMFRFSKSILWGAGILTLIAFAYRFAGLKSLFSGLQGIEKEGGSSLQQVINSFSGIFGSSSINFGVIGLGAMVVLTFYLIDRLIIKARKQATSINCFI